MYGWLMIMHALVLHSAECWVVVALDALKTETYAK